MIQKLKRILSIEDRRYRKKGPLNVLLALALLFGSLALAHSVGQRYWPEAVEDKMSFVTVWSIALNLGMEIVGFMLYLPGYLGWSKYYSDNLVNKKSSRPWQRPNWVEVRSKLMKNFMVNQIIIYPIIIYLTNLQGIKLRFESFPSFQEFSLHILFIYYFEDVLFYCFHRVFHIYSSLYRMHKVHHEYDTLYTWVAEYHHPGDFLFANLLPGAIPLILMGDRLHCFTFFFWILYKIMLSCENHSGYHFHWSPFRVFPMIADVGHHDNHHSNNVGNFGGSCYFWDIMLDTYVPYTSDY